MFTELSQIYHLNSLHNAQKSIFLFSSQRTGELIFVHHSIISNLPTCDRFSNVHYAKVDERHYRVITYINGIRGGSDHNSPKRRKDFWEV